MITREALGRLERVISQAATTGHAAVICWGSEAQENMVLEECGELVTALARLSRGRTQSADIVNEAADVIITAIQIGIIHCNVNRGDYNADDLIDAIAEKTERLAERIRKSAAEACP